jgi:2-C-methyl-D-erythritol 4-phosphate cytidylyltransferase
MTVCVLLAGGTGSRISSLNLPKQFAIVKGKRIIEYALSAINDCGDIDRLAIVAAEQYRGLIPQSPKFYAYAEPGETRQQSIYSGLLALSDLQPDLVVIHDAARPLATSRDLSDAVSNAANDDGATPVLPMNDTVYQSNDKTTITALLNRDTLFAGQAPECYNYSKYLDAHRKLTPQELSEIRGSSEIAFKSNMKIHLFSGNSENIKITTEKDLKYFEWVM